MIQSLKRLIVGIGFIVFVTASAHLPAGAQNEASNAGGDIASLRETAIKTASVGVLLGSSSAALAPTKAADLIIDTGVEIPPLIPTKSLAARSAIQSASISPDGRYVALLQKVASAYQITIVDASERKALSALNFGAGVQWFKWVGNDRMLVSLRSLSIYGGSVFSDNRLFLGFPMEGRAVPLSAEHPIFSRQDVLHIAEDNSHAIVAHRPGSRHFGPGVYKYELKEGGAVTEVVAPGRKVDAWIADEAGTVRLGLGWESRKISMYYRDDESEEFRRIARFKPDEEDKFFDALQFVSGETQSYVLDENEEGRVGLRVFDFVSQQVTETVYENPDWDVDDVWFDNGKPMAVFYTDDRSQVVWFDQEAEAIHNRLKKALKGFQPWIVSRSKNGRVMLVTADNEADPGVLYIYDADAGTLREFAQYRPEIDFRQMVKPQPVTYTARDGTLIRAYLTLPKGRVPTNLPMILHPHGGPFGVRDQLRYDDHVQMLANRGYAVLQPNFRGSGGYGTAFYDLGNGEVGRGMQDDLDDAMDWAVSEGIADPARVCIVGASYGGYAALWGVLRNPERYRCAASWAGVTDWTKMLKYDRRVLSRQAGKRWSAKIEGDEDVDLKDVSPYRLVKELERPILLAHGSRDSNVPIAQYELMVKAAKKAKVPLETLVIEGEGHSFSKTASEEEWFDALDAFLAKHNPADMAAEIIASKAAE